MAATFLLIGLVPPGFNSKEIKNTNVENVLELGKYIVGCMGVTMLYLNSIYFSSITL